MIERNAPKLRERAKVGLRQQVLLAALQCSGGDLNKTFTAEDLLLSAWRRDPGAWGLRGHEDKHPDSEKIYKELDRVSVHGRNLRGGMASLGLLEKVRQRTYRLTPAGLASVSELEEVEPAFKGMAERSLADAVATILSHPVFREWQKNSGNPKYFRDAGHFWGVAPGTPPSVIRTRIANIDNTLQRSMALLDKKNVGEIMSRHGRALFDRQDILRAMDFHKTLKERFGRDLSLLGVPLT